MFDIPATDTHNLCGLQLNDVGQSYFLLRGAQLSDRQLFDLRLRVDGDLGRYQEIRKLLTRMFGESDIGRSSTRTKMSKQFFGRTATTLDAWYGDWNTEHGYPDADWSTYWQDGYYDDDDYGWQEEDETSSAAAAASTGTDTEQSYQALWGKRKRQRQRRV